MTSKTEKRIQDFKKKNQKYLKARHKTDKQISVTKSAQKTWLDEEDWKINAWDPGGNRIIKNGKPTKYFKKIIVIYLDNKETAKKNGIKKYRNPKKFMFSWRGIL